MELHLYELLKFMSKGLRPNFDCGDGSQIFSDEEVHNIHSHEKRLKTAKTLMTTTCQQKTFMYQTIKLFNFLITLYKNTVREISVVNEYILVNIPHNLKYNYIQGMKC